MIVELVK